MSEDAVRRRLYLIVHGWQNHRPATHWQSVLAERLRAKGHTVHYPQLPEPDTPSVPAWLAVLSELLTRPEWSDADGERVVICHSLGCMAWLHLATKGDPGLPVDRLLFVAPPSPIYLASEPAIAEFRPLDTVARALVGSSTTPPRLVFGDNDRYCPGGADQVYPGLFDVDRIPGGGHLDEEAGYGEWPSLLAWCEDPTLRIQAAR